MNTATTAATATIPFNRACLRGREAAYIAEAINGGHISGDGPFVKRCQSLLEATLNVPAAILTTSCTAALETAALLLNVGPGDEVIVPSFTFVSTANAFALRGAKIVFADSRPDTLNLDETRLEALITPRTRAIVPVHYGGVGCEMDAIMDIAGRHGIPVVEDNAHGLFGRYREQPLGTFGCLATQSFHETKNFTCGEGGALLINDRSLIERAEIIRDKGTNRSRFFRGQVDKYTWTDLGSSYCLSDIQAAFLLAQLEGRKQILRTRHRVWDYYYDGLESWAANRGVGLPTVPSYCKQAFHLFYLMMPSLEERQALIAHLRGQGISSVFHYQPLNLSPMGRSFGGYDGQCPVSERAGDCLLRLPFYNRLGELEQARIVEAILSF